MFNEINNFFENSKSNIVSETLISDYTKEIEQSNKQSLYKCFYPLKSCSWDQQEKYRIFQLLKDSQLTMGLNVKKFEEEFSKYIGSKSTERCSST